MKVGLFNTAFVGDVALMGRLIDALYQAGHEIILFSNSAGCSLYEFDNRVSKRVVVRKKRGVSKIRAIVQISMCIRSEQLDTLLLAHRSMTSGLIALLSGVQRIVTFSDSSVIHRLFHQVSVHKGRHESDVYLELAEEIASEQILQSSKFNLFGDEKLSRFCTLFPDFLAEQEQSFFICAPGSVWSTKRYPAQLLAHVICLLLKEMPTMRCVLSGGPADTQVMDEVLETIKSFCPEFLVTKRVFDARGCLPLPELIELMRRAAFVLTPDSAPLHIASATQTKTFAFFGPTPSDTGFGPLDKDAHIISHLTIKGQLLECQPCSRHGHDVCPLKHHRCLADLSPDAVAGHMLNSMKDA